MVGNLIKIGFVFLVLFFILSLFPSVYNWVVGAIQWILSLGKWGYLIIASTIIVSIIDLFN